MAEQVSEERVPGMSTEENSGAAGEKLSSNQSSPSHSGGGGAEAAAGGGGSSWWGSWIDTAKSKSASVLEAVKKDLDELTTVVKTEATNAGSAIAETLNFQEPESTANTVKKSLSSFFGQVSEVLSPSLTEDDDTEAILITKDGAVTLSGFHKHLAEMQVNDDIYLIEPDLELAEKYQRWMEVVDQDQFTQQRLDKQLASSHILQEKYERLVPKEVTHMQFWQRYLFKRALLEDALANADLAERRARQEANSATNATVSPRKKIIQTEQPKRVLDTDEEVEGDLVDKHVAVAAEAQPEKVIPVEGGAGAGTEAFASIDEELSKLAENDLKWGNTDFTCDVELSEEEQARLLAEYEQEIQERERKTSAVGQKTPKKEQMQQGGAKGKGQQQQQGKKQAGIKETTTGGQGKNQQQKGNKGKGGNAGASAAAAGQKEKAGKGGQKTAAKDDSDESWEKEFDLDE